MSDGRVGGVEPDTTAIWDQVRDALRAFIARRVANEAEAEDLLQEVFLRVHRQMGTLQDPDRVVPWVFQITRNAVVDYYRAPARHREVPAGLAADLEPLQGSDVERADGERLGAELAGCLRPMLHLLSPQYREAVTLVELEGLTQQEAARRMGLSLSGMKSRVQRGRRQLKQLLDDCCLIQLDRRGGVADYESRDPECDPCRKPEPRGD